jgi:hypothetical protein
MGAAEIMRQAVDVVIARPRELLRRGHTGCGRLGWRDGFVAASGYGMPPRPVLRLVGDQALASPQWTVRLRGYSL